MKPGDRITAILGVDPSGIVKLLGHGVFDGHFVPPDLEFVARATVPQTRDNLAAARDLVPYEMKVGLAKEHFDERRSAGADESTMPQTDEEVRAYVDRGIDVLNGLLKLDDEEFYTTYVSVRYLNPRLTLDNGDVLWGYQCWWGPTGEIEKTVLAGNRVVLVDLNGNPVAKETDT